MKNYMKPSDKEETLLWVKAITGYFSKLKANKSLHQTSENVAAFLKAVGVAGELVGIKMREQR